jgi:AcrR family transcriptional regulator
MTSPAQGDSQLATRDRIIAAAIRRFEAAGVTGTTMAHIADEAGLSRQTVYRLFDDRPALLEAILMHRFIAVLDAARVEYEKYGSLREALVEGPIFAMRLLNQDALFLDMVNNATDRRLEDFVLIATPEVRDRTYAVWGPLFAKARLTGELQSELSNVRLAECLRSVAALLILRSDLDDDEKRRFLADFLVPACGIVEPRAGRAERQQLEADIARTLSTMTDESLARFMRIAEILS